VLLQLMITYTPALRTVFHTVALTSGELLICSATALTVYLAVEGEKWIRRRGPIQPVPANHP